MMSRLLIATLFSTLFIACTPSPRYSTIEDEISYTNHSSTSEKPPKEYSSKSTKHTKRTTVVNGKKIRLQGEASWYGPGFQGNTTANGEKFNMHKLTAAHPSLPFNTKVEVTNLNNGRSVVVRINDRGPYAKGRKHMENRIIDISKKAAQKLGFIDKGVAPVKIRIIQ